MSGGVSVLPMPTVTASGLEFNPVTVTASGGYVICVQPTGMSGFSTVSGGSMIGFS